mgnify:CR=1 FL=1
MSKDIMKMTTEERVKYWEKEAEKKKKERQKSIDALSSEQMEAVKMVRKYASMICDEALHGAGVRYIYCDQFTELEEALGKLNNQFNLLGESYD